MLFTNTKPITMKKIVFSFFFSVFLFCVPGLSRAQMIVNDGPSYFTLIKSDGNRIEIGPFFGLDFESSQDSISFYIVELKDDGFIESRGFCYMIKEDGDFHLQNMRAVSIFLENSLDEEILVEYHKYAFIMYPQEKREIKDIYITHDLVTEIKISYLIGDENLVEVKDGNYMAQIRNGQIVIKL